MSKREKIFNICIVLFISIAIILGIGVISIAAVDQSKPNEKTTYSNDWKKPNIVDLKKGETFSLSMNELESGRKTTGEEKGLFCVEHEEKMSHYVYKTYKVVNVLRIKNGIDVESITNQIEKKGEGEPEISKLNAQLAAGIFYSEKDERQKAVWYYMYNWFNGIIQEGDIGKSLSMGMVNKTNERN